MRLRVLPPVAAPSTPADIMAGVRGLVRPRRALADLADSIGRTMAVRHVFLTSSGRAALTVILRALARGSSRRRVVVPAYTCFSVAASVVKAGLELVPCDVDPATLDFDFEQLRAIVADAQPLAVVSVHLFGRPADIAAARALAHAAGAVLVDDAAQAFGFRRGEAWLGTEGDVGFFSFGRGKAVSACGGGAIVTNSETLDAALAEEWERCPDGGFAEGVATVVKAAVLSVLVRPRVYWLPASLPFLGIGETVYSTAFGVRQMSGATAGLLASWPETSARMNRARVHRLSWFDAADGALSPPPGAPCLRLPVMCATRDERERLCEAGRRAGLGIVPMYPTALTGVGELADLVGGRRCPGAEAVANCLATVPVHPLVSDSDMTAIGRLLPRPGNGEA